MLFAATEYTRANTMWVFLVIGAAIFVFWAIAAILKSQQRVTARRKARRTLKSVGYETEREQ